MITTQEAFDLVSKHLPKWDFKTREVKADRDYPPFDRVMMDGIALKFDSYQSGQRQFRIEGVAPAGETQKNLGDGCLEVMTGAPLPVGADLVIQYEHLLIEKGIAQIVVEVPRAPFDSVHRMGSDCKKGETVLSPDLLWNGPRAGIAASMGASIVRPSPKVLIISTGDELVENDPLPHQIRRSNAYALKTSLELNGYSHVDLSHLKDDPKEISSHYKKYADEYDMLIYSGGVSKGKFDYLPHIWADMGVTKHFHEVAQKPGRPMWFGVDEKLKTVVVGLPGNPVSSLVCLHRYLLPGRKMTVKLSEEISVKNQLTNYIPVEIEFHQGVALARPLKIQNSGEFTALEKSDGFIEYQGPSESYSFFSWRNF